MVQTLYTITLFYKDFIPHPSGKHVAIMVQLLILIKDQ